MSRFVAPFVALLMLVFVGSWTPIARADACTVSGQCLDVMVHPSGGRVPFFRSHPLKFNATVRRAVVVIHGNRRDPDRYFEGLVKALGLEADPMVRLKDTVLLAPHFRTVKDKPEVNGLYWRSGGWKVGDKSRDARRVSSYSVADEFVSRLCAKGSELFPKLDTIVFVGHSAGGQFVNRYAAGGTTCGRPAVELRYVVMNPSSYMYVDDRRAVQGASTFARPSAFGCPKFDEYKYGMRDLNSHMKGVGKDKLRERLFNRTTFYVAGILDTKKGSSLDKSCEANLQGANRFERWSHYRDYARMFKGWVGARFVTVPSVGHRGSRMLQSEEVRKLIFR